MFKQPWNTNLGWGYAYQWFLAIFVYYLVIERHTHKVSGESGFNSKVNALQVHIKKYLGTNFEASDIYLEWHERLFEDINIFFKSQYSQIWFWFIQSKTKHSEGEKFYPQISQIRNTIKNFFLNQYYQSATPCCFVIACNTYINNSHKKWIYDKDINFKNPISKEIFDTYPKIVSINNSSVQSINHQLDDVLDRIFIFDGVSSHCMQAWLMSCWKNQINPQEFLMKTFYESVFKSTRHRDITPTESDHSLYELYSQLGVYFDLDSRFALANWKTNDTVKGGFFIP